jgi:hypothetical protein
LKKILVFLVCNFILILGYSQNFQLGIKGGLGLYSFYGKDIPVFSYKPGSLLGITARIPLKNHTYFQSGLQYEMKGGKRTSKGHFYDQINELNIYYDGQTKMNYSYLTIPFLLHFGIGQKETFFVNGGPFIGYMVSAIVRSKTTDSNTGELLFEEEINYEETGQISNINRFDIGLNAGGGANIRIFPKIILSFEAIYSMSFLKIYEKSKRKQIGFGLNTGLLYTFGE